MSAVVEAREPSAAFRATLHPLSVRHFELLATARGGIDRIRELILALAVQGKLVAQDPSDEPAALCLDRMRSAKVNRPGSAASRAKRPRYPIEPESALNLPAGWVTAPLADVVRVLNGRAYGKQELLGEGTPVLRVGNLFTSNHWYYSTLELEPDKYCTEGDLLYAWSASFGPFIWPGPRVIYHYHIWKLDPLDRAAIDIAYLHTFLQEKTAEIKAAGHGVSMVHMTKEKMERIEVPLPPLSEQARIVARVDELMRLCDALEAKGQLEAAQHALLLNTLLGTLTDSGTAEELAANWQRVAAHFDLLIDRPEAVDALEQTILQLAVRGLLVQQDPLDEPATTLLDRIRAEKSRLISAGTIKRERQASRVSEDEQSFALPTGWAWTRWIDVAHAIGDIDHRMPMEVSEGIPYVSPRDFFGTNDIDFEGAKKISESDYADLASKIRPEAGDLIYPRYGTIGNVRLVEVDREFLVSYSCALIKTLRRFIDPRYQYIFSMSSFAHEQADKATNKTTQPNVGLKSIQAFVFPLPPLAEQSRIVIRVDQLLRLCADLRQRLADGQSTQARLAEALVESATT